ncbi:type II toxin-antitoxin system prevent-host-death family antitoxin [Candidatus Sumerlaeota bacterium]|nr:type II toxin-antitoxin system prevent-host-death family antitoxin [Candidatus Sumerlaeota bacterium]
MYSEVFKAFDAKTHFSELLDRVARGERIAITRYGVHVATLVPAENRSGKAQEAARRILARRETMQREGRGLSIRQIMEARDEGRK